MNRRVRAYTAGLTLSVTFLSLGVLAAIAEPSNGNVGEEKKQAAIVLGDRKSDAAIEKIEAKAKADMGTNYGGAVYDAKTGRLTIRHKKNYSPNANSMAELNSVRGDVEVAYESVPSSEDEMLALTKSLTSNPRSLLPKVSGSASGGYFPGEGKIILYINPGDDPENWKQQVSQNGLSDKVAIRERKSAPKGEPAEQSR